MHNHELNAEFNWMIRCELAYRNCVDGWYYYPVTGSDDRRCVYTCENVSTCGSVTIPEDHLKVSAAANRDLQFSILGLRETQRRVDV